MEIKSELKQPYTENQKLNFIVEQNHKLGYEILQVETTYEVEEQIPYTEIETEEMQEPVFDEEGNPVLDEDGNQTFETKIIEKEVVKYKTEIVEKTGYNLEAWGYTEEEIKEKERERINLLSMTKREMFLGLYQAKQITPDMLKAQITDPQALIEFEYANDYFRGNVLIDQVGAKLGITSEQLDRFFETKDYKELLPAEEETEDNGTGQASDTCSNSPVVKNEVIDENTTDATDISNEVDTEETGAENTDADTLGEQETVSDTTDSRMEATDTL